MNFTVRLAQRIDMESVLNLITELAVFEKEPHAVDITVDDLIRDGFSEPPKFRVFVAEQKNTIINSVPLRRMGTEKDIADAAIFLSEAEYVTGQILNIDGGKSLS